MGAVIVGGWGITLDQEARESCADEGVIEVEP